MTNVANTTTNQGEIERFFDTIFPPLEGGYIEIRTLPSKHQRFFKTVEDAIDYALSVDPNENIYFGVNPRVRHSGKCEDVPLVYNIIADLDFKDLHEEDRDRQLKEFPLTPTAVVHSGGGYQGYWTLKEPMDAHEATSLMKRLHQHLKGDPVSDSSRILRVPGTFNWKYDPPRKVTIASLQRNRYAPLDFYSVLPRPEAPTRKGSPSDGDYLFIPEDGGRNNFLTSIKGTFSGRGLQEGLIDDIAHLINDHKESPFESPLPRHRHEGMGLPRLHGQFAFKPQHLLSV